MNFFKSLLVIGLVAVLNCILPALPGVDGKEVDIYFGQEKDLHRCPYGSSSDEVVDIDNDLSDLLQENRQSSLEIDNQEERRVFGGGKPKDVKIIIRSSGKSSQDRSRKDRTSRSCAADNLDEVSSCPLRLKSRQGQEDNDEEIYIKKIVRSKDGNQNRQVDADLEEEERYSSRRSPRSQEILIAEVRASSPRSSSSKRRYVEKAIRDEEIVEDDEQEEDVVEEETIRSSKKISRSPSRSSEERSQDKSPKRQDAKQKSSSPKKQKGSPKKEQQKKSKGQKKGGKKGKK